jgi:ABC-2 type transport system ATP-binding protein
VINTAPSAKEQALLASVSPSNFAKTISAPTLLTQGEADSLFPLSESSKTAAIIKAAHPATPLAMIWHSGGHDGGVDQSPYLRTQYLAWLKKYLMAGKTSFPAFQFTKTNGSISLQDSTVIPKVFTSSQLPISAEQHQIGLVTPTVPASYPIGGIPSAISALPGIGTGGGLASRVLSSIGKFSPAFIPGQSLNQPRSPCLSQSSVHQRSKCASQAPKKMQRSSSLLLLSLQTERLTNPMELLRQFG